VATKTDSKLTPKFELLVEGSPADAALLESIITIRVHQHLELADAIEVRLSNNDLTWTDGDTLAEGKKLTVKLGYEEGAEMTQVASGEIVRRDCEFPIRGPAVLTVVAYDREHRLKRGVRSRTFLDMKDSEIVSQIVSEAGLSGDVEDSGTKHRYVFQSMQTNLSFIRERAMLNGFHVDVDRENSKVTFKKAVEGSAVTTLKWGENLLAFSPRMSSDEQVSKVTVRGWDMQAKVKLEGSADKGKIRYALDGADKGAKLAEDAWGAREVLYVRWPFHEAAEAAAIADSLLNQHALRYCEGEASCQGEPKVDAGVVVRIEATSKRTDGDYYVSRVLHHYEPGVGYSTHFSFVRSTERLSPLAQQATPDPLPPREMTTPTQPSFVEFRVVSETGESLEGTSWKVTLPNGSVQQGTLGADQTIRIDGVLDPGDCHVELNTPDDMQALGE